MIKRKGFSLNEELVREAIERKRWRALRRKKAEELFEESEKR